MVGASQALPCLARWMLQKPARAPLEQIGDGEVGKKGKQSGVCAVERGGTGDTATGTGVRKG